MESLEEIKARAEAAVPGAKIEIVPNAAVAAQASLLLDRDHASAVAFVTGHEDPTKPASALDYHALASFPGTLVFYMGLHRLEAACLPSNMPSRRGRAR